MSEGGSGIFNLLWSRLVHCVDKRIDKTRGQQLSVDTRDKGSMQDLVSKVRGLFYRKSKDTRGRSAHCCAYFLLNLFNFAVN